MAPIPFPPPPSDTPATVFPRLLSVTYNYSGSSALDAGVSLEGALPPSALLRETREHPSSQRWPSLWRLHSRAEYWAAADSQPGTDWWTVGQFGFHFSAVLFNDAASCWYYIAPVMDEWMGMEHWWNDTDRGKLKYWEQNILLAISRKRTHLPAVRSRKLTDPYPFSLRIDQRLHSTLWFHSSRTVTSPTRALFMQSI